MSSKRKSLSETTTTKKTKKTKSELELELEDNNNENNHEIKLSVSEQRNKALEWAKTQNYSTAVDMKTTPLRRSSKSKTIIKNNNENNNEQNELLHTNNNNVAPTKITTIKKVSNRRARNSLINEVINEEKEINSEENVIVKETITITNNKIDENIEKIIITDEIITTKDVKTPSKSNNIKIKSINDDNMVPFCHHYCNALKCSITTIIPTFILLICLFYGFSALDGNINHNIYSKYAVIVALVYATILILFFFLLLPLILITRAVDKAIFANGATILTSSIIEISVLTLFVIGSLLMSAYNPNNKK